MKSYTITLLFLILSIFPLKAQPYGYGTENLLDIGALPRLRNSALMMMESSSDRKGQNNDGWFSNYLYKENGANVIFDESGPGLLQVLWQAGIPDNAIWNFYFDGDSKATYQIKTSDLFSGNIPFLPYPLVLNADNNSGGCVSYVSVPFQKSLKISIASDAFFILTWYKFPSDYKIDTWNRSTDFINVMPKLHKLGSDPKNNIISQGKTRLSTIQTSEIAPDQGILIFTDDTAGTIYSVKLKFNGLDASDSLEYLTDNGLMFKGKSTFEIKIPEECSELKMRRRHDYSYTAESSAFVYIDSTYAGLWKINSFDLVHGWIDKEFTFPKSAIKPGKVSKIEIRNSKKYEITIWNDFFYYFFSNGIKFDSLDICNKESENAHKYKCEDPTWIGTKTMSYHHPSFKLKKISNILSNSYIKIYFDDAVKPDIYAPLSLFFAVGHETTLSARALMFGLDSEGYLYNFYPAPYFKSCKIELCNNSKYPITNLSAEIDIAPNDFCDSNIGILKTEYRVTKPDSKLKEIDILCTEGDGHIVGTVYEANDDNNWYMEGDWRAYIDNARTPWFSNTGTDDYFNCGFYFNRGSVSNSMNGQSNTVGSERTMYRSHIIDPIPFKANIRFSVERTDFSDYPAVFRSLCFYYLNSEKSLFLVDSIEVGNAESEDKHHYKVSGNSTEKQLTSTFEGITSDINFTDIGRENKGVSSFDADVSGAINGIRIYRTFNWSQINQKAKVFVDGEYVGIWFNPGFNNFQKWREDAFLVPQSFVKGKSRVNLKFVPENDTTVWTEYQYKIYADTRKDTVLPDTNVNPPTPPANRSHSFAWPNPAGSSISFFSKDIKSVKIFDILGNETKAYYQFAEGSMVTLSIANLPPGVYFAAVQTSAGMEKFRFIKAEK